MRTTELSLFLNSIIWGLKYFSLVFWKKIGRIMKTHVEFSVGGFWGQPMLLFWKLVDETQISKPPESTRHHNSIKLWILLPLIADLLYILQYETPCMMKNLLLKNTIDSGINVGVHILIFGLFSCGYVLIKGGMFSSFFILYLSNFLLFFPQLCIRKSNYLLF